MKRSELKALILEMVEEIYNEDFAPLGVAEGTEEYSSEELNDPSSKNKREREKLSYKNKKEREAEKNRFSDKNKFTKNTDVEKMDEKAPPGMKDDVKKAGNTPEAYKAAWKKFYSQHGDKSKATKQVKEMWLATEGAKKHDETDMGNPEEKREVELAKKAKEAADAILKMHGK